MIKSPSARSDNLIYAYGEVPRALDLALRTTRLTNGVIRTLAVNRERMWQALESGFSQATDLTEYVMQTCGVDYRTAYQVVGIAVRAAHEAGLRGLELDGEQLDAAAVAFNGRPLGLTGADLTEVLDPRHMVETRTATGGAAPPVVEAMAASCSAQAADLVVLARQAREAFAKAETALHRCCASRRPARGRPMTDEAASGRLALPTEVDVVNVGLPLFASAIAAQDRPVVHVDWRIPAGGDPELVGALRRLFGPLTDGIDRANAEVRHRLDTGVPMLTRVCAAAEGVPELDGRVLLHPGPALEWPDVCDPLRRSMRSAVVAEGWADDPGQADALLESGSVTLAPANESGVVVPMAAVVTPTTPGWLVELAAGGVTTFAPLGQGPGDVAWFGKDSAGRDRPAGHAARGGGARPVTAVRVERASGRAVVGRAGRGDG